MENKDAVSKALGKISSGLYVVTSKKAGKPVGFTASFLVQVSFDPPLIAVSMKKGRESYDAINESKVFAVNVMTKETMKLVGHFAKPTPEGTSQFDSVPNEEKSLNVPILKEALAYLECRLYSTADAGDHIVVFGEVVNGEVINEGEPATHVRKNGFSY